MAYKKGGVIVSPNETAIGSSKGGAGVYNGEPGYPKRSPTKTGPPEKVRDSSQGFVPKGPSKQSY
jgi:hypothetical protein